MRNLLVKRNEHKPLNWLDSFFGDFFNLENDSVQNPVLRPSVDIKEDDKAIHVEVELPGLEEKDIDVNVEKGILTVKGEKKEEKEQKDKEYHRIERRYGSFERSFKLPDYVKAEDTKASYKNGVLKLEIPKEEAKAPKKLKIAVES